MEASHIFIALAFLLAGLSKGVVGFGLPTIALGLLAAVMPLAQAASILILPSLVTNLWQMLAGPYLPGLVRRLWPMLAAMALGTIAGVGWIAKLDQRLAAALVGTVLVAYALSALAGLRFVVNRERERLVGLAAGLLTGLVTAATGIYVIPALFFYQAIGLERDELVQALGLSFMVSTVALAVNLAASAVLTWSVGPAALVALAAALIGMGVGMKMRRLIAPETFRRLVFLGLLVLGLYLAGRAMLS